MIGKKRKSEYTEFVLALAYYDSHIKNGSDRRSNSAYLSHLFFAPWGNFSESQKSVNEGRDKRRPKGGFPLSIRCHFGKVRLENRGGAGR